MPASNIDTLEDAAGVGMTPEELQGIVERAVEASTSYIDSEISVRREEAQKYYRGEPFGNEEEGRSQYVSRDLHDTVRRVLPSLMRVFFGSERNVEYMPRRGDPRSIAAAQQATDYARYIVHVDNDGYLQFQSAFKDALYQVAGVIKWWWDESIEVTTHYMTGLDEVAVQLLLEEPGIELAWMEESDVPGEYNLEVRRKRPCNRFKFEAVPPEEFVIDRWAKSIDDAYVVAHVTDKTVSDLVAMGYDEEMVREHTSPAASTRYNHERSLRLNGADLINPGEDLVKYCEIFIRVDYDGDGVSELRRICTLGEGYEIADNQPWDHRPFADFCVDPVPHTFFGYDLYDQVGDLQRVQSEVTRLQLDSFAHAVYQRYGIVEGQVNIKDVLNPEMGAPIRMRQPGMVQPLSADFAGAAAFPLQERFERIRDARTGVPTESSGLDPKHLQSTTASAVNATVQGAQQQLEMIARNFADRGLKRFYRGLLRTIAQHQDEARVIKLRGEYVEIDPRSWDASMNVSVNVVLGAGLQQDRINTLRETIQYQSAILQQLGPNNPLVTVGHLSKALTKFVECSGFKDSFFNELPDDFELPTPPPQPSPEEMLMQAQTMEIQSRIAIKQAELQEKAREADLKATVDLVKADAEYDIDQQTLLAEARRGLNGQS